MSAPGVPEEDLHQSRQTIRPEVPAEDLHQASQTNAALRYRKSRETGQVGRRSLYLGDGQRKMLDVYEDRIGEALDPILGKLLTLRSDLRECNSMIENLEPLESGQMQIEDHRGRPLLRARLLAERDQAFTRAESRDEHLDENSVWKETAQFWRDKRDKLVDEQGTLLTQLPWAINCFKCWKGLTNPWDRCGCTPTHKRSRPGRW